MKCLLNGSEVNQSEDICILTLRPGTLFIGNYDGRTHLMMRTNDVVILTMTDVPLTIHTPTLKAVRVLGKNEVVTLQNT
jgi:hypothetical protein